ncbi:MAG: terminase family protein [Sphingomonadales bacterium]|jgi:phage FluMu gp28-like protein
MTSTAAPAVLLPYQQEAIRLSHQHQLFVSEKSRRTGLTYGFAADAVTTAAAAGKDGKNVFYIAYNLEMTREFVGYCADFAKAFGRVAEIGEFLWTEDGKNEIKAFRIDFPSGYSIVALSSRPRSLRGMQGNVIIDEAAFHEDLDGLLAAAQALTMWGGHIVVISTHQGADNPFNVLVEEIRSGKTEGVVQRLTLADALEQGLYKRMCLKAGTIWTPEAEAAWETSLRKRYRGNDAEELDVMPSRGSGIYFARATVAAAMAEGPQIVRLRLPDGFELKPQIWRTMYMQQLFDEQVRPILATFDPRRRTYVGGDCGRKHDLSVFAFGQEDEFLNLHARLTIELRNCPFREQEELLRLCMVKVPLFTAAKFDARGLGWSLAEAMQSDFGFERVEAVQTSQQTYLDGMPKLRSRIEDRRMVLPLDDAIRDDFTVVKLVRGVPTVVERTKDRGGDEGEKRHGDSVIAYMYLTMAADADVQVIEFASTGQTRASFSGMTTGSAGALSEHTAFGITDHGFGSVAGRHDMQGF